jgi:hypothetical protein
MGDVLCKGRDKTKMGMDRVESLQEECWVAGGSPIADLSVLDHVVADMLGIETLEFDTEGRLGSDAGFRAAIGGVAHLDQLSWESPI